MSITGPRSMILINNCRKSDYVLRCQWLCQGIVNESEFVLSFIPFPEMLLQICCEDELTNACGRLLLWICETGETLLLLLADDVWDPWGTPVDKASDTPDASTVGGLGTLHFRRKMAMRERGPRFLKDLFPGNCRANLGEAASNWIGKQLEMPT